MEKREEVGEGGRHWERRLSYSIVQETDRDFQSVTSNESVFPWGWTWINEVWHSYHQQGQILVLNWNPMPPYCYLGGSQKQQQMFIEWLLKFWRLTSLWMHIHTHIIHKHTRSLIHSFFHYTCTYVHANSLAKLMCTWQSQDACALGRHCEPCKQSSWSQARNLQENRPFLTASDVGT